MTWNLFDLSGTWLHVRDATLARDRASATKQQKRIEVAANVRVVHAELAEALRLRRPAKQVLALAREDLDLLRKRYNTGSAQLFEVLDAQDKLIKSELAFVDRTLDLVETEARMTAALGRH
jgi:outer membrane protein TolC